MDVGSWLRSLGLGQYEAAFRDNKIDADLLPRLTDAGLKDIGVSALGDRLRLLDAIAALASEKPLANSTVSPPKAAALRGRDLSAERRPITVMFCDLVGSTSLAAKLDAEDWRNLVNAYSAAVTDFGGHVLKKLGDGLRPGGCPSRGGRRRAARLPLARSASAVLQACESRSGLPGKRNSPRLALQRETKRRPKRPLDDWKPFAGRRFGPRYPAYS